MTSNDNYEGSFKNQFNLTKGKDKNDKIFDRYSYLNAPTTYSNEPITPNNMHPFNYMDMYKTPKGFDNAMRQSSRRDNTILINNYYSNETGEYAKPKKEINNLFEPIENLNAQAGDTEIVNKIGTARFLDTLKYKQNDYNPETMYVRPELIDGPPMTEVVRPREKSQQDLRGFGVNSIRLDSESRNNMNGQIGEGVSLAPSDINITKYKMLSYRTQDSIDDLLRTTGAITRPEWRSMVKETASDRSYMKNMDGPAVSYVMKTEYHNEQAARPTLKENTIVNNYLSNAFNNTGTEYRNEQAARPTIKEETEHNTYLSNAYNFNSGKVYNNNQAANPTIREQFEQNTNITNTRAFVDQYTYRNEQSANPTIREQFEQNTNITNPKAFVDQYTYRNEQSANPTIREQFEQNTNITNAKAFVDQSSYRNEQSANPTIRENFEQNTNITNAKAFVDQSSYRNEQSALPTLREDSNKYINHGKNSDAGYAYENNQASNPTNRTQNNIYINHGNNVTAGYIYENNQSANPTNRTQNNEFMGTSYNNNAGYVYENQQSANPTNRDEDNEFEGIAFSQATGTYKLYGDKTRSGVVEEVLAKDYTGPEIAFVTKDESRLQFKNMVQNESIENSINLVNRDLMGGGTDRIPQGKDNIGQYVDRDRREKDRPIMNRVRNIGVNYIEEVPETRGYNILQERSAINEYVPDTLKFNPFVNNVDYKSASQRDFIRENTIINDRNFNRK